ncbi:helix-turn-helix transcriptional regulator [Paenibacillus sp. YYML68]|uniref:helix-turn-helix transcriptional regulator n=1 Tax=Paenibacillus sp. YYML68 TaxID=2909250 RepID=UPI0024909377|nr:helix-turn-helix transcriptional regulator [Paenibacillus sp. YYML68]
MSSTIGERIRTVRKSNKLSQVEFANIAGVSQGTLSELEQDKYKPSLDTIIAL